MDKFQFIKESIKNLKQVGTVMPSSKSIVKKMIEPVNFKKDICILEIGSGTGTITTEILKKMSDNSTLICFETNKKFYDRLKEIDDQRAEFIFDSAENIKSYVNKNKVKKIDYIISSVPILILPDEVTQTILDHCSSILGSDGKFIQLQYSKLLDKKIKKYFKFISVNVTLKYYLPGFIYTCSNSK